MKLQTFTVATPFEDAVIETVLGPTGNPRMHIAKGPRKIILAKCKPASEEKNRNRANWPSKYVCKYFTGREPELMIIP